MVAAAVVGSAVIGGAVATKSAKEAASAQKAASKNANATQLYMYDQTRNDQEPYRDAGQAALSELQTLTGAGGNANLARFNTFNRPFEFNKDPGYQFRMDEGLGGVEASAAARGGALSGRALKELERYGQGFASNEYNNAFSRFQTERTNRFNRLAALAGIGQQSVNQTGILGANTANQISGNQIGAGNAQASGQIATGNAINNTIGSLGNWYQQYAAMNPSTTTPSTGAVGGSGFQAPAPTGTAASSPYALYS